MGIKMDWTALVYGGSVWLFGYMVVTGMGWAVLPTKDMPGWIMIHILDIIVWTCIVLVAMRTRERTKDEIY